LKIISEAVNRGQKALSEYESKIVIQFAGVPITKEGLAKSKDEAVSHAEKIGFPVVMKGCSDTLIHKTEMGMVKLNITNSQMAADAYNDLTGKGVPMDGVLVQEMIKGNREFVIGFSRDAHFGPCVMFGLGGIFTEALKDVVFRMAPLTKLDAAEMLDEIKTQKLLKEFRGAPMVDRDALIHALVGIGNLGAENENIAEIDINPLIIAGSSPVAVDALVILKK
jgi:succinyl-CoA synthetase beta subunit